MHAGYALHGLLSGLVASLTWVSGCTEGHRAGAARYDVGGEGGGAGGSALAVTSGAGGVGMLDSARGISQAGGGAGGNGLAGMPDGAGRGGEPGSSVVSAGASPRSFWSCGTAAGVCSCVSVDTDLGALAHVCAASACCFFDESGGCSCRMTDAALDCSSLKRTLGAERSVASCPP